MDVFEKIEEYEKKVSSDIKNKMDLFTNLMHDREIFEKMISNTTTEVAIDPRTQEVLNDIKSDKNITELIIATLKNKANKVSGSDTQTNFQLSISKDSKPKSFNSKEHGSNLSISNYVNYFDQKEIRMQKPNSQFYNKDSELNLMKIIIAEEFMTQIKKKFYIAYHDSFANIKPNKQTEENEYDLGMNSNSNSNRNYNNRGNLNKINTNHIKRIVEHNINHLYPKRRAKEDLMDERLLQQKMIEFHFSGKLSKQVDIEEIMTNYKINEKKKAKENNFDVQMNLTNLLVNNYNEAKSFNPMKKKKIVKGRSIEIEGIASAKDYFIHTRSKLYVKLDRNRDDIKLSSIKGNKRVQLPPVN